MPESIQVEVGLDRFKALATTESLLAILVPPTTCRLELDPESKERPDTLLLRSFQVSENK